MKTRKLLLFSAVLFLAVVSCKKDSEVNKDTFKIENEKVEASTQSVKITGTYAYLGAIDGLTLELGRQADLMDGDAYRTLLEGTDFSVEVKNLRTNTTYYYRYSVDYGGKAPYRTEIKTFKTEEYNLPEVKSKEVVSVGVNRAEVSGEVLSDGGGDAVTLRGICWSMSHNPSVGDEYANAGEGIGTFTCELTNLQPEKTYYARAFAGNSKGVSYGEELTFVTLAAGSLAVVKTIGITGNANLQATVSGEVTNEGANAVLERGVCYGKEHFPTTSGLHVSAGSGTGEFNCQLTNLEANATYYVRAYAINGLGVSYGEEMSFEAQTETTTPVVTTQMVSGITQTSATGHGAVVSDGGATVTRRGLCWSTEHNPTADVTHADCGSGVGEFSGLMPHLEDMTTYYVRAYAENSVGMAYGEEVSFTVGQNIIQYTVNVSANPSNGGTVSGGGIFQQGEFCTVTALANSGYTFANWSENGSIVSTDDNYTFTVNSDRFLMANFDLQPSLPTVSTYNITNITQTSAIIRCNVISDGNATVTERGVCWSTSPSPTTSGNHESDGSGTGGFAVELTNLTPNTTYYVRAYAINSVGTKYGNELSFTTLENGEWLHYDDGTYATNVGTGDASATIYWATMFPAASLAPYAGTNLTKVAVYENSYNTNPITVTVYLGGTTAPGTAYSTQTFAPTGNEFQEVTLYTPVAIDGTQNLWIVMAEQGEHPATACADTGDPNNRWISLDGADWMDVAEAGVPGYGWMIRGFVTNERGETMELKPIATKPHASLNGKVMQLKSAKQ